MRHLMWLWALPLSLLGLVFWLIVRMQHGSVGAKIHAFQGMPLLSVHSPWIARGLNALPMLQADALCLGWVVLAADEKKLAALWSHELVHVKQALRWGAFFPLLYAASSLWAVMRGRDAYLGNVFEQEAFALENSEVFLVAAKQILQQS